MSAVLLAFAAEAAESRITLGKDVYEAKEPIVVEYEAAPGKPNDFITIVKQGTRAGSFAQYHYLRLKPRGRFEFRGLPPGIYEARLHRHGVAIPEAIARLIVEGGPAAVVEEADRARKKNQKPSLEIADPPVQTGEEIKVAFKAPGTANDWITIVRHRAPGNESGRFEILGGKTEGTASFEGLPPGRYEVRLFGGDRNRLLARTPLTIEGEWRAPEEPPLVKTEKPFYRNKESIVAHYEGAWIKDETDHLLIAEANRHDSNWTRWITALHAPEGWVRFQGQFSGGYELRLYRGKSKNVVARYRFDVGEVLAETYPELAGGALAEAVGWAARCDVLVDWITAWRHDYPMLDPTPRRASQEFWQWLTKPFLDPAFIPVFGSPIEEISPKTREFIYPELLRQCRSIEQSYRVFFEGVNDAFGGGFQSRPEARANLTTRKLSFERVVRAAERHRVSAKRLAEAEATLDTLVMDETAYSEVLAVETRYASDLGWATAGEVSRYRDRLETKRTSAASIALRFRADELVASAEGLAGAHALAAFEGEQAQVFSHADEAAARAVRAGIEEAIATQL
ncbi:MAG: hypothetical protein ACREH6_01705, partial [Geminicoccaceae bacterium]